MITKLTTKAANNCSLRYDFVNILLIFTFSNRFKGTRIGFPLLGHNNDNEAVVCSTKPRRYIQIVKKCYDGFS